MRIRSLVGALPLAAALLGGPPLLTQAGSIQAQDFCSDWLSAGNVCELVDYCWESGDPVCDQLGSQAPRDRSGY